MANAQETREIYNAVLKRDPSDEELAFFVANTQTEAEEDAQIEALVNSGEADAFVDPIVLTYQAVLDRVPDEPGLDFWVNVNRNGTVALETIITGDPDMGIDGFQFSDEFIADYGTDVDPNGEEFVTLLYRNLLNREPDEEGFEFYTNLPETATVGEVVLAFINSEEFQAELDPLVDIFLTKAANGEQDYEGSLLDTNDDGVVDGDDAGAPGLSSDLTDGTLTLSGNADADVVVNLSTDPGTVNGDDLDGDADTVDASGLDGAGLDFTGSSAAETVRGSEQSDVLRGGEGDDLNGNGGDDVFGLSTGATANGGEGNDEFHLTSNSTNNVIEDFDDDGDEITFLDNGDNANGSVNFANSADNIEGPAGSTLNASDLDATASSIQGVDNLDNRVYVIQGAQTEAQIATEPVGGGAENSYVVVFNQTSGKGEIWFDSDWADIADRSKVATLDNITSLSGVTALTAADFGVYATDGSDAGPDGPDDLNNIALTPNADFEDGTDGNDNFVGAQVNSLNSADDFDGLNGDDQINVIQTNGAGMTAPTLAGIEQIFIEAGDNNVGISQANITGLNELWVTDGAGGGQTFNSTNSKLTTTYGVAAAAGATAYNINFAAAAAGGPDLSGGDDTLNLAIDSTDTGNMGQTVVYATAGMTDRSGEIEGISLTLVDDGGATADTNTIDISDYNNLESFTATGNGNLTVAATLVSTDLSSVDVAGVGGDVTIDATASTANITYDGAAGVDTFTGGSDDDTINGNGGEDVIDGGVGDDLIDGGAGADDMTGGAGLDIFVISDEGVDAAADLDAIATFSVADDSVDFADFDVAGTAANFEGVIAAGGTYANALAAANAEFDGTVVYVAVNDAANTYIFADTDFNGEADQGVQLTAGAVVTFEDIIA